VDVHLPVKIAEVAPKCDPDALVGFRSYISSHGSSSHAGKFSIPDPVAEAIQADFVSSRQSEGPSAEEAEISLKRRMRIARYLASNHD
jgi:hypothetical protein